MRTLSIICLYFNILYGTLYIFITSNNLELMKTNAIITQHTDGYFFGFIQDVPAICAQADSADAVVSSLKQCAQFYYDYMAKSTQDIGTKELVSL